MEPSTIYWISRLDAIKQVLDDISILFTIFAIIGTIAFSVCVLIKLFDTNDSDRITITNVINTIKRPLIYLYMAFASLTIVNMFIPTAKDMAAIVVIPYIATAENCEKLNDISKDLLNATHEWLNQQSESNKKENIQ